jgi:hemerythrin-like domain-containing protein
MTADTSTQQDAIQLLTADHGAVEQVFRQIEAAPEGETRDRLVETAVRELSVHAAIEEQVLYPAMRRSVPNGDVLVEEAIEEHQQVKDTLAAIERSHGPAERDPLLVQLMGNVRHHVEEEEGELFPLLRSSIGADRLRTMGSELAAAKRMAPTHPHPHAPNTPPGNVVGGAAAALVDKARDALRRS